MIKILYSPPWFFNYDIVFDFLSALVTFIIAHYAYKIYKISKEQRYKYFSLSFILIGVSFLAKMITYFVIYHPITISKNLGVAVISYSTGHYSYLPLMIGLILSRILFLIGLLGLYLIITKYEGRKDIFYLITFLLLINTIFSWSAYFVFHFTSLLLLFYIYYEYAQRCKDEQKGHSQQVRTLSYAFLLLVFSQVSFIFVFWTKLSYVVGESLQLLGFGLLAYVFWTIRMGKGHGKKKNEN
ncbi:MAG: hypothetical protein QW594_00030 [Candidatus Woesearchaeota archaeon]